MQKTNPFVWVALIAVAIIALGGYAYPQIKAAVTLGGTSNVDELDATAMKIGGANGSRLGPIIATTCSLIASSYSVAASTTVPMDCAVTGLVSGDLVQGWFASSTGLTGNGWEVTGGQASSTSGFATFSVTNQSGTSNIIPAKLASSTEYFAVHPVSSVPGL